MNKLKYYGQQVFKFISAVVLVSTFLSLAGEDFIYLLGFMLGASLIALFTYKVAEKTTSDERWAGFYAFTWGILVLVYYVIKMYSQKKVEDK